MQVQGERMPPHNNEAEQSVLGSVLLQPSALISAMEYLQTHDFYRRAHQLIYQAMIDLNEKNEEIDVITVANLLETNKQLEDIGGAAYLADLANVVPTAANITYYAKIVEERSLLRRLIQASTDIITETYEESDDVSSILDAAEQKILEVSERKKVASYSIKINDNTNLLEIKITPMESEKISYCLHYKHLPNCNDIYIRYALQKTYHC